MRYVVTNLTELVNLANEVGGTLHINTNADDELVPDGAFDLRRLSILGPCPAPADQTALFNVAELQRTAT